MAPQNPFRQKPKNPFRDEGDFADVEGGSSSLDANLPEYGMPEAVTNGVLAGFGNEAASAVASLVHGTKYKDELARTDKAGDIYAKAHPVKNIVSEGLGMIAPAVLTGGENIAARLGVKNVLGQAAINQGALGALYGAGNAKEGHRGAGAVAGGVVGGLVGPAAHLGLKAIQHAAEMIPGVNTIGQKLGVLPKPGEKADKLILQRLGQDKLTPEGIRAETLSRPDTKPETLLDMGRENTTSLGKLAVNSPGEGRHQFGEFVTERQANAPTRVSEDLTTAGMNPVNKYTSAEALKEAKKKVSRPLYEAALQGNPVDDPAINAFLGTPEGHAAFRIAQNIRRKEAEALAFEHGRAITPKDYALPEIYKVVPRPPSTPGTAMVRHGTIAPDMLEGDIQRVDVPDDHTLHYMKLALDDMAKYGFDMPGPGGTASTKVFASRDLAKQFRQHIGKLINGYDEAAGTYSAGQHMEDAFDAGTKFLKDDGQKSSQAVADMTPYEKELFKLGAGSGIRGAADRVGDRGNIADRVFGSKFKRDQISAALDDPQAFEGFGKAMGREKRMAEVNRLQGGSHTQPMAMEGADAAKAIGVLSSLAKGNVGGAAWRMSQRLGNGMTQEVTDAISARMLSGKGGRQELLSALDALTDAQKAKLSKSGALASLIAAMSGRITGASVR